ncbi:hypothetical protein BLOT_003136, partial [Blomia tropicalis]
LIKISKTTGKKPELIGKMNFKKSNKDVKRASYYVWFLGSKESKGLRGDEYVTPVLNYMLDNECNLEPSKVTLQVSNKGMKIIQILTVPRKSSKLNSDQQAQLFANVHHQRTGANVSNVNEQCSVLKTEQVKHHIPHNSITWVYQEDDVICAILLLYNPITRCPVHVHAYRCDSVETADNLRQQLQTLTNKQLKSNKHESNEIDTIGHGQSATAALYDSLAAELRAKLGNPKMGPILLPPRDYDAQTIIDNNNKKKNDKNKNSNKQYSLSRSESSGKSSSGIGSDEALANENQTKKSQPKQQQSTQSNQQQQQQQQGLPSSYFRHNRHYRTDILMDEQHNRRSDGGTGPQSFIDIDRRKRHSMAGYLYGNDRTDKSLYNSLQMYNSSEDEIDDDDEFDDDVEDEVNLDDEDFEMPIVDQVDAEDIEEDVIFTTSATVNESNRRSKMISNNNHQRQPNRSSSSEMRNKTRIDRQTSQFHEYDNRRNVPLAKMYASNPNISRMPLKEVKHQQQQQQQQQQPTIQSSNRNNISNNNGDKFVIGRREQRQQQQQQQNRRPKQYYFADAEFSETKPSDRRWSSQRYLARSNGNLVHEGSGPTSLAIHPHSNDRSVSPAYIYTERIDPRVMAQTKSSHYNHLQHQQQPQQQQQLKSNHSVPMKASKSSTNLARGPISSRFDSFDHYPHPHHQMEPTPLKTSPSSTTTTTKHQQQHTSNLMNTPAAIAASAAAAIALRNKKKQLEQPFSRYSYAEHVHHGINNNNRESLFSNTNGHNLNYLLPARR